LAEPALSSLALSRCGGWAYTLHESSSTPRLHRLSGANQHAANTHAAGKQPADEQAAAPLLLHPEGRLLLAATRGPLPGLAVWRVDPHTGQLRSAFRSSFGSSLRSSSMAPLDHPATCLALSPDGCSIAAATSAGQLFVASLSPGDARIGTPISVAQLPPPVRVSSILLC
jgi:hypothetical protein